MPAAQSIPFTVEAIRKIAPERIVDLDATGRWPALLRVHTRRDGNAPTIEAITNVPLDESIATTYDHIAVGPVPKLVESIDGRPDAAIIGSALLRFDRDKALEILGTLVNKARYTIIELPLGHNDDSTIGNEPTWTLDDLAVLPNVRRSLYRDSTGRLRVTMIASHADPMNLRQGLSKIGADFFDDTPTNGIGELKRVLDRIGDQSFELDFIKNYSTYRLGRRLVNTPGWNAMRWLRNRNRAIVTVRATGEKHEQALGSHVHIRHAAAHEGQRCIPWDFAERGPEWQELKLDTDTDRTFIWTERGRVRLPLGEDPQLTLVKHPYGGKAEISFRGRTKIIDLFDNKTHEITVFPARDPMVRPAGQSPRRHRGQTAAAQGLRADLPKSGGFTEQQTAFIKQMKSTGAEVCAVHTPRWMGITASTNELFEHCYPIPNTRDQEPYRYDERVLEHHAYVLAEAGARHIVFSGGDRSHLRLAEIIHERDESITIDMLWHASYVQFLEDYNWEMLRHWIDAAKLGVVRSIGTVKAGMEQFLESVGVRSALVLNLITGDTMDPPTLDTDERHIGMWISGTTYRKIPHPMLAAVAMTPNARLHAAGLEKRSLEVIDYFGIETAEVHERTLPHDELLEAIRRTHITLYVTFSECCPMVPLESLQLGVPCLTGPNSHLFQDNEYLFERLVVPFPDRADTIAEYMKRAIDERDQIIDAYRRYIPGYNERALQSVRDFIAGTRS